MFSRISLLILLASAGIHGQSSSYMAFGDTRLSVGMARQEVLKALSAYQVRMVDLTSGTLKYRLCDGDNASCNVLQLQGSKQIGSVRFQDGRLIEVHKYSLGEREEEQGVPLARAFYSAIATLVDEGRKACTINTSQIDGRKGYARTAFVICGERSISIQVNQSEALSSVSLSEHLVSK